MQENNRKRMKFVELAGKRTQRVIDSIESLGNLANTNNYEYTKDEFRYILREIRHALNEMQTKFEGKKEFRLSNKANKE